MKLYMRLSLIYLISSLALRIASAQSGTPLAFGEVINGTLQPNAAHTFTFTGVAGQMVIIQMTTSHTILDPYLEVLDPSGDYLGTNDDFKGMNAQVGPIELSADGEYTIIASGIVLEEGARLRTPEYELSVAEVEDEASEASTPVLESQELVTVAGEHFANGNRAAEEGDYLRAAEEYTQAITLVPEFADAYLQRANALLELEAPRIALRDAARAFELAPEGAETYQILGRAYMANGNQRQASANFARAVELNPSSRSIKIDQGRLLLAQGRQPEARALFDEVIAVDPTVENYVAIGKAYLAAEMYFDAMANFVPVEELDSTYFRLFALEGAAIFGSGFYDEAIMPLQYAVVFAGNSEPAYRYLGLAHFAKGEYELAIQAYHFAIKLNPFLASDNYVRRSQAYQALGNTTQALNDLNQAVVIDPLNANAYYARAQFFLADENLDSSLADFTSAIMLNPQYAEAYAYRGLVFMHQEKTDLALSDFLTAVNLNPSEPFPYVHLGDLFYEATQYAEARSAYRMILQLSMVNDTITSETLMRAEERIAEITPQLCSARLGSAVQGYDGPGVTYPLRLTFDSGQKVDVQRQAQDDQGNVWWLVHNGAWVRSDQVQPMGNCDSVRVAAPDPVSGITDTAQTAMPDSLGSANTTCTITTLSGINLRGGPGTNFAQVGTLSSGQDVTAVGQATGGDGFIWWHLADDAWVRSDLVAADTGCDQLPVSQIP